MRKLRKPGVTLFGSRTSPTVQTLGGGGGPPGPKGAGMARERSSTLEFDGAATSASSMLGFVLAHGLAVSEGDVDIRALSLKLEANLGDAAVIESAAAISSTCRAARARGQPALALRGTERMRAGVIRMRSIQWHRRSRLAALKRILFAPFYVSRRDALKISTRRANFL